MRTLFATLVALCFTTLIYAQGTTGDPLTNEGVVDMVRLKLGEAIIISSIESSPNKFNMGTTAILSLKKDSVPDAIVAAMMKASMDVSRHVLDANDCRNPHRPGIYYYDEAGNLVELLPSVTMQNKTRGSLGTRFSYGIAKTKNMARIAGDRSRLEFHKPPKFYFYFNGQSTLFDQAQIEYYGFRSASSPNEFVLAHMEPRKDVRELETGSGNAYTQEYGIDEKAITPFQVKQIAPGVFEVDAGVPQPGQYCFVFSGSAPDANSQQKLYDFGVN